MEVIITFTDNKKLTFKRNPADLSKARLNKEIILLFPNLKIFTGKIRRRPDPDDDTVIIYPDEGPIGGEVRIEAITAWCYAPKTWNQEGGEL